ncbi:type II toxin-antitoxin system PemK/MazF family toxin [Tepidimonas sp.]|uniref:type II toxin-antitoxin system PemK/MazF family toxin n=1 Tax=Tepidimonas sp. TaxID=2002775 RepID=UPI00391A72F9
MIVSNNAANRNLSRVVVPVTSNIGRQYPGEAIVTVGGQSSQAMADQIMAADQSWLKSHFDVLSKADMLAVEDAGRRGGDQDAPGITRVAPSFYLLRSGGALNGRRRTMRMVAHLLGRRLLCPGGCRTRGAYGVRDHGPVTVAVGGRRVHREQDRLHRRDAAPLGAPGRA